MSRHGRGGGAPGKGNPGGNRGGNRGGQHEQRPDENAPHNPRQSAGKDPHRGQPLRET